MRIGIISNSDQYIPMAYTLASRGLQVCIFYAPSEDNITNQKVHAFIQAVKLPFQQEMNASTDVYQWLENIRPDIVFVYGYRYLLDVKRFNSIPAFNIHPGPLPSFRGPVPVFWQLKTGQPTLGFTIHELSDRFDAGKVVWTKTIPDMPHYHYGMVHQLCSQYSIEGATAVINMVQQHTPFAAANNAHTPAAYHKRPQLKDVLINWLQMEAVEICNLIRACSPWNKGAITVFNGQELRLMDAISTDLQTDHLPGTIVRRGHEMYVTCLGGRMIRTNMLYLQDAYIPAYHAGIYGLQHCVKLG